ncbi:MAG: DUF4426 domain-containing protein, partial [Pseudomonadales bacterium]|nr:DUF4426 domain-containing protein [Pseudomonadales bacterium]
MLHVNFKNRVSFNQFCAIFIALFFSCSALAQDVTSVRKGAYEVFYSVFNSSFLQPETAVAVGVKRAKNIALINLSIREHLADGTTKESRANLVKGTAFNL